MQKEQEIQQRLNQIFQNVKPKDPKIKPKKSHSPWALRLFLFILLFLMVVQINIDITPEPEKQPVAYQIVIPEDPADPPSLIPVAVDNTTAQAQEETRSEFTLFLGCSHRRAPKPEPKLIQRFNKI